MTSNLDERLDQILPKILSEDFLAGKGLGNEIGFWVFDYLPKDELAIRRHLDFLMTQIPKQRPHLRIAHVNLFDLMLGYLKERKLLDKAIEMQQAKGDEALQKALAAPLHGKHIAAFLAKQFPPRNWTSCSCPASAAPFPSSAPTTC